MKKLIRSAVKKEVSKGREITNSYIQENKNKILKLEDEIKRLKNRRPNTKPSNSSLFSSKNPLEILGVCCLSYLMLIVMTSF